MRYLTEDPWPLTVTLIVFTAFFAWNAARSGNKKVWQLAAVFIVLAIVPLVVDQLVETDREVITSSLHELADAVVDSDLTRALSFLEAGDMLSGSAREVVERGLDQIDVHEGLRIKGIVIKVDGTEATSDFRANGTVDVKNVASDQHAVSRWLLAWKKSGGDWKVTKITRLNPLTGDTMGTYDSTQ